MPPSLDKPGVPGGVSETCLMNDHPDCHNPRCNCSCHKPQVVQQEQIEAGPEKSCPVCGAKRPFIETFCRIDGARLSSLACNICGIGREPTDRFCFSCGAPADAKPTDKPVELPKVINVPSIEPEVDYGRTVLAKLQEELGVQTEQGPRENQTVVEQPAGTQGSFKLVSRPNPNRVRVPAGGPVRQVAQESKPIRKLPIKPS